MNLAEIVYQIDGKLRREFQPDNTCKVTLIDNTGEVAQVRRSVGPTNEWRTEQVEAVATGKTPDEAEVELVNLMRGNVLIHNWPIMWTSSTSVLRIPDTLVVSNQFVPFPIHTEDYPPDSPAA